MNASAEVAGVTGFFAGGRLEKAFATAPGTEGALNFATLAWTRPGGGRSLLLLGAAVILMPPPEFAECSATGVLSVVTAAAVAFGIGVA